MAGVKRSIIPLDPQPVDLNALAPFVAELVAWLGPGEWPAALVGLVRSAPAGLLAATRAEMRGARSVPTPWTLDAVVRHALVPLAALSLVDGQPAIPPLGAVLLDVLADPRLDPAQRREIETVLIESEDAQGWLDADARGA